MAANIKKAARTVWAWFWCDTFEGCRSSPVFFSPLSVQLRLRPFSFLGTSRSAWMILVLIEIPSSILLPASVSIHVLSAVTIPVFLQPLCVLGTPIMFATLLHRLRFMSIFRYLLVLFDFLGSI